MKDGYGYYQNDTTKYEGEFKRDKFDGQGILINVSNNITMDGNFEEGLFLKGIVKLGDTLYEGQIKDNLLHGKGVLTFKNNF